MPNDPNASGWLSDLITTHPTGAIDSGPFRIPNPSAFDPMPRKAAQTPKPAVRPPGQRGPDPIQFSREQRDDCRRLIGGRQYVAEVVRELVKKHKFGEDLAHRLIAETRAEILEELAGRGVDPATGLFLFFESVMADRSEDTFARIAAGSNIMKLLGLKRITERAGGEDVDAFLLRLLKAQQGGSVSHPNPDGAA